MAKRTRKQSTKIQLRRMKHVHLNHDRKLPELQKTEKQTERDWTRIRRTEDRRKQRTRNNNQTSNIGDLQDRDADPGKRDRR